MTTVTVGAVAIGRNECDRLRACLGSLVGRCEAVVYVDSGSSDDSVRVAESLGVEVVSLDPSLPFSAARARNAGFARLLEIAPDLAFVQFVDGDCEVVPGWIDRASAELDARPDLAVACGRRRERHPERSIYNRLADLEWDTPIGEADACGGDSLMRCSALRDVGGFDPLLIAGEEPELCHRLRSSGWKVARLDAEMTLHDLGMTRFAQWWRRQARFGYAAVDVTVKHRGGPFTRQALSASAWSFVWLFTLAATFVAAASFRSRSVAIAGLILALAPAVQALRIASGARRRLPIPRDALAYGALIVAGKWAEAAGQARWIAGRVVGRRSRIIEYKSPLVSGPSHRDDPGSPLPFASLRRHA